MSKQLPQTSLSNCQTLDQVYHCLAQSSPTFADLVKRFFTGPSTQELMTALVKTKMELDSQLRRDLIFAMLRLAELNQLSDQRFTAFMMAIMS